MREIEPFRRHFILQEAEIAYFRSDEFCPKNVSLSPLTIKGAEGNLSRCKHPFYLHSLSVSDSNGVSLLCQGSREQLVVAKCSNIMIIEKLGAGLSYA